MVVTIIHFNSNFVFKLDVCGSVHHTKIILLLSKRYNSCRVLAFSTIFFHSWRSWACSVHLRSFIFLRSFLTWSSYLCLGLPTGRVIYGCHLCIFFTMHTKIHKEKSNKMQQCIKILLFLIYMKLNMFRATNRPSSGA